MITAKTDTVIQTIVASPKYLNMGTTNLHIMNEIQCKIPSIAIKVPSTIRASAKTEVQY